MGGSSAEVVSIGTRRPDYSRIACGRVAGARRALGLDRPAFAALIGDMLGWDIAPEIIEAWEDDSTPPGDVLIACSEAAQGTPGIAVPLLAGVPPAFPADALDGPWVTCYRFSHGGQVRHHADIARVTAESASRIRAVNHPPEPRSEGRAVPFRNEISAGLAGRHLAGEWRNISDTRYYGVVELAVLPGETVMMGGYYGVGSDIEVSAGSWKWVRLDAGDAPLDGITLREPAELYDLVMSHAQNDVPLILAEVREGS